jgi:hypothetical protein
MPLLGHQGGWDEALFVLAPVGLFAFLLWLANRRAASRIATEEASAREAYDAVDAADADRNGIWDEVQHDPSVEPAHPADGDGEDRPS